MKHLYYTHAPFTDHLLPACAGFGIHKPHLPWAVPERFFRGYNPASLPLALHKDIPTDMPPIAWHRGQWGHFNHSFDPIVGHVSDEIAREARHGYFAAVSFADDLVGKALDALDETGKANDTVVLLTADHGWQLGEHNEWCKQTLFDVTLHIPFIIRAPGTKFGRSGQHTGAFAELVDLYRTLAELAGLHAPAADVDGQSLAPLLDNPEPTVGEAYKQAAYSQMARCLLCLSKPDGKNGGMCPSGGKPGQTYSPYIAKDDCADTPKETLGWMGFSIRTPAWRFTQWVAWDGARLQPNWAQVNATELYTHACDTPLCDNDFDAYDKVNVVADPSHASTVAALEAQLRRHYENSSVY
jgi:iduronate 2-sulfatase